MTPRHHPTDELLLGYATGALTDAVDLVIATHLTLCPRCRAEVARLEAVGGALLESAPQVDALGMDAALDAIFEAPAQAPGPIVPPPPGPAWLPQPLRSRVGALPDHRWQRLVPGVIQQIPLPSDGGTLRLVRMRPGARVPDHSHHGDEFNLVLAGGFRDRDEDFERGDLALASPEVEHDLVVEPGEHCVILQLLDGPIVPKTLLGQLVGALTGES